MTRLMLVIHAPGDPAAGSRWREPEHQATLGDDWNIVAPDLPGHGTADLPEGGNYDSLSPAFDALRVLIASDEKPDTIVGIGASGWAAQMLHIAGHGSRLVLIDGLGAPWHDAAQRSYERRLRLKAVGADGDALAPWKPGDGHRGIDPRLSHGVPPHHSLKLATEAAESTSGPVLIIEADPLLRTDTAAVTGLFSDATVVTADSTDPRDVVPLIATWL